jgi:cytoskeletal protein RodZ
VTELTSGSFIGPWGLRKERRDMAEIHSIKDAFRDPLIIALVLVGIAGVLTAAVGSIRSHYQNNQEVRATNQPSTQSLPADTKPQSTQSQSQAPAITEPSSEAPATGETTP